MPSKSIRIAPVNQLSSSLDRFALVYHSLVSTYGPTLVRTLMYPECLIRNDVPSTRCSFQKIFGSNACALSNLAGSSLSLPDLRSALVSVPVYARPGDALEAPSSRPKAATAIVQMLSRRCRTLESLASQSLAEIHCSYYADSTSSVIAVTVLNCIRDILAFEFGSNVISAATTRVLSRKEKGAARMRRSRREKKAEYSKEILKDLHGNHSDWPQLVPRDTILQCLSDYRRFSQWKDAPVCAVCSQMREDSHLVEFPSHSDDTPALDLSQLRLSNSHLERHSQAEFVFGNPHVDGLMLDRRGFTHLTADVVTMNMCRKCYASLKRDCMPQLALANGLFRGRLPPQFSDLTWIEEMVCAIYRNTAHVTRLFRSSSSNQPTVLHGNTCAHEMNVVSTAKKLPCTPADINGMLTVVFVGPGPFKPDDAGDVFRVRKEKILAFLLWLRDHNRLYSHLDLDMDAVSQYPDDGPLPGIEESALHDERSATDARSMFNEETAGIESHPASLLTTDTNENMSGTLVLEKMGVSDPESTRIPARRFVAKALSNLTSSSGENKLPDLVLHRGEDPIPEYNNPDLVPGMYPTLYPLGIGGFDDKSRESKISFQHQAQYYLNLPDKDFRYHYSFIFVILNMIQRRKSHLHTHFTVNTSRFKSVAEKLTSLSAETLADVAEIVENEKSTKSLSGDQRTALDLLRYVNTVGEKIPGSHMAKISSRADIRNYFGYFGLSHIFLTFNPNAAHSPIFQVMYGDKTVDLNARFPTMPPSSERAKRLAQDPVAAADFFDFSFKCLFEHLLGWDFSKGRSKPSGGILGHLRAFYGTTELTERGGIHGHILIWLRGGINPTELHTRMKASEAYQKQFFQFFESIIYHHLPDVELEIDCAKAAMFYITDYITKMDMKTYEMLSLMSRAVSTLHRHSDSADNTKVDHKRLALDQAKTLLHRCLSQYTRQQQIHAQQAARYLRGFDDTISSHVTVPMMSGLLFRRLQDMHRLCTQGNTTHSATTNDEDEIQDLSIRIMTTPQGSLIEANQIDHYLHRSDDLSGMSFYDFCRCVKIHSKKSSLTKNSPETRLGVYARHELKRSHPLHHTHHLVQHTNEETGDMANEYVPKVLGMSIPRVSSQSWPVFALMHFKPFSENNPLLKPGEIPQIVYDSFTFGDREAKIMSNWEAIHECEDERDAERIRKRAALLQGSDNAKGVPKIFEDLEIEFQAKSQKANQSQREFEANQVLSILEQAHWITHENQHNADDSEICNSKCPEELEELPPLTSTALREWKASIKEQESIIAKLRTDALNPENQSLAAKSTSQIRDTEHAVCKACIRNTKGQVPETDTPNSQEQIHQDSDIGLQETVAGLNTQQTIVYNIITQHFMRRFVERNKSEPPLRMLMTGPGGTGKTHVVRAVRSLMAHHGCAHRIRFLAPTGSAAALIDGMTIHKGLGIRIEKANKSGKGNHVVGEGEDLSVLMSVKSNSKLRDEWKNVDILFLDEVSLLSAQLLCEIDYTLRYAKENPAQWFGGTSVIFSVNAKMSNNEIQKRLGRMAWKTIDTVVDFSEQHRMKSDKPYAEAVQRLRTRSCSLEDVDLFNSRVVKSSTHPHGVDMGDQEHRSAAAIVNTNRLREELNMRKARTNAKTMNVPLIECTAKDVNRDRAEDLSSVERTQLTSLDISSFTNEGALPGVVPLHVGMPGGFGAYVAASRAKSRDGLCLLQPVTLRELNKPLPEDLINEIARLKALEHNTLIRHKLANGDLVPIPNPEAEVSVNANIAVKIEDPEKPRQKKLPSLKRKQDGDTQEPCTKRQKKSLESPLSKTDLKRKQSLTEEASDVGPMHKRLREPMGTPPVLQGCRWSSEDWSCAYDSVITTLANVFFSQDDNWKSSWKQESPYAELIGTAFQNSEIAKRVIQSRPDCVSAHGREGCICRRNTE
ncbi:hypothetical protein NMY22_g14178 [Coprinellus aureogranulatus]|nr:hypothetical protein NMY22_g14178 [Coprinellus aureogranulatus]